MSVRAIAIRSGARPAPRPGWSSSSPRLRSGRGGRSRASGPAREPVRFLAALWAAFADDRRLIGVKLMLMGLLLLTAMALEAPW